MKMFGAAPPAAGGLVTAAARAAPDDPSAPASMPCQTQKALHDVRFAQPRGIGRMMRDAGSDAARFAGSLARPMRKGVAAQRPHP